MVTPTEYKLANAYPNPFNSRTNVTCDLPERSLVSLKLYDISGREVTILYQGMLNAGSHSSVWDATDAPSGVYICKLESGNRTETLKLPLIR